MRLTKAIYGGTAYAIFLGTFLYAICFVNNVLAPKTIDVGLPADGISESMAMSVISDLVLLSIFAVQHSVMARPGFKRWWTRIVPPVLERSTYVLLASMALLFLFLEWRPLPGIVWDLGGSAAGHALTALGAFGWLLVLAATFQIDHFELFGLHQVWRHLRRRQPAPVEFRTPMLYRQVRHPIYLGFMLAFWSTPVMSTGHLLFAAVTSAYILIGIAFEERDLIAQFGDRYLAYRNQVGMLLPRIMRRGGAPRRS